MITCPLCCTNYLSFTSYLCDDCNKIKRFYRIYGKIVLEVLEDVLVIKQEGRNKKSLKLKNKIVNASVIENKNKA
tara:strand:+ start:7 stop:231 length:225 start_codon:yes stop_codon:yes gene_type:complete